MNENLRAKITGRLDALSDEMGRQLLDYLEFLESKHNRSRRAPSPVQKLTESLEDKFGSVSITDVATKGAAQVMETAGKLMDGLAAASRVVAEELQPEAGNGSGGKDAADTESEPESPAATQEEEETPPSP
jgi:hypothetical protein